MRTDARSLRAAVLFFITLSGAAFAAAESFKPNIVVILADDFGWGSSTPYGAKGLNTPNLDRLAREGRRFTHAYAPGSVCSPSRYGLMTGRYYWRTAIKDGEVLTPTAPLHIEPGRLTIASLCQSQGYRTGAVGKWHLGLQTGVAETDWNQPLQPGPRAVGFDYFYGLGGNPGNGPHAFIEDENIVGRIPGEKVVVASAGAKGTTTGIREQRVVDRIMETLAAKATNWVEANHASPFFLYFAPNAVHGPIAPNARFTGSSYGSYGDFIHELDWSVGQILATLDRLKLTENTLVIFTSDNGGIVDAGNGNTGKAMFTAAAFDGNRDAYVSNAFKSVAGKNMTIPVRDIRRTTVNGIPAFYARSVVNTQQGQRAVSVYAYEWSPGTAFHFVTITAANARPFDGMFESMSRLAIRKQQK